jgi:predicted SAM-dependent methyltransferase
VRRLTFQNARLLTARERLDFLDARVECGASMGGHHGRLGILSMSLAGHLKALLYTFGLDETARIELSTFVRGAVAMGAEKLRRPTRRLPGHDYLHLGCGSDHFAGFTNIDRVRTPATDVVVDVRRTLPFASASMRGIFHQHAFEHIDRPIGARTLLRESARVLLPGGVLRMGVPDLARYVEAYSSFDKQFAQAIGIHDVKVAAQIINHAFAHGHRFLYDFDALRAELADAGFRDIRKAGFRDSVDPMLNQDNDEPSRLAETLFVEARR